MKGFAPKLEDKMSLGHSVSLLDQLDKDLNTYSMCIREWYSYHFPELYKIVPENYLYAKVVKYIGDRKQLTEEKIKGLEIIMNAGISEAILSAAKSSMAGSRTNLAKCSASTVQILGAEKALFRAMKTKTSTPKYGLIYHSTFIGRDGSQFKGRASRFLSNKLNIVSRIDAFSDNPCNIFGHKMKQQCEDRLKYFENGERSHVMHDAGKESLVLPQQNESLHTSVKRKKSKKEKKSKRIRLKKKKTDFFDLAHPTAALYLTTFPTFLVYDFFSIPNFRLNDFSLDTPEGAKDGFQKPNIEFHSTPHTVRTP
ncbi:nucleolar protein 56 [Aphis craccivora]|uniref:Nucleolar protein 56 n=1 Tax=Aphis craccivora TaxID=307492 RepID=A0A6G0Y814_APHCR|nr:nucleolar protein 56 [Aphis craccivora]